LIDSGHLGLSIVRQCELVSVSRSTFYREPVPETAPNLTLMRLVDEQFLETPWYGSRQIPLCQRSCRLNRIGTFGGADSRKWLDTAMQKSTSMVFDTRQLSTFLVDQSITVTR
jgi:hypothetical protein